MPVFVKTTCFAAELPVATVPKLMLFGLALSWPVAAVVAVPFIGMVIVGLVTSLLVMLKLPVAVPAVVGEKVMTTWAD